MPQPSRATRAVQILVAAVALLAALAGLAAWRLDAPRRELAAARARWEAAPVGHYRMLLRMKGWGGCTQDAVVRNELVVAIATNTCRYHSPRTVSGLFVEAERFLRSPEVGTRCRRGLPGRDCACYAPYAVATEYDQARGFPSRIQVHVGAYQPNRAHLHYWRFLLSRWREPTCGGPVEPAGSHIVVELFEPMS